jgi:hypothetical protein
MKKLFFLFFSSLFFSNFFCKNQSQNILKENTSHKKTPLHKNKKKKTKRRKKPIFFTKKIKPKKKLNKLSGKKKIEKKVQDTSSDNSSEIILAQSEITEKPKESKTEKIEHQAKDPKAENIIEKSKEPQQHQKKEIDQEVEKYKKKEAPDRDQGKEKASTGQKIERPEKVENFELELFKEQIPNQEIREELTMTKKNIQTLLKEIESFLPQDITLQINAIVESSQSVTKKLYSKIHPDKMSRFREKDKETVKELFQKIMEYNKLLSQETIEQKPKLTVLKNATQEENTLTNEKLQTTINHNEKIEKQVGKTLDNREKQEPPKNEQSDDIGSKIIPPQIKVSKETGQHKKSTSSKKKNTARKKRRKGKKRRKAIVFTPEIKPKKAIEIPEKVFAPRRLTLESTTSQSQFTPEARDNILTTVSHGTSTETEFEEESNTASKIIPPEIEFEIKKDEKNEEKRDTEEVSEAQKNNNTEAKKRPTLTAQKGQRVSIFPSKKKEPRIEKGTESPQKEKTEKKTKESKKNKEIEKWKSLLEGNEENLLGDLFKEKPSLPKDTETEEKIEDNKLIKPPHKPNLFVSNKLPKKEDPKETLNWQKKTTQNEPRKKSFRIKETTNRTNRKLPKEERSDILTPTERKKIEAEISEENPVDKQLEESQEVNTQEQGVEAHSDSQENRHIIEEDLHPTLTKFQENNENNSRKLEETTTQEKAPLSFKKNNRVLELGGSGKQTQRISEEKLFKKQKKLPISNKSEKQQIPEEPTKIKNNNPQSGSDLPPADLKIEKRLETMEPQKIEIPQKTYKTLSNEKEKEPEKKEGVEDTMTYEQLVQQPSLTGLAKEQENIEALSKEIIARRGMPGFNPYTSSFMGIHLPSNSSTKSEEPGTEIDGKELNHNTRQGMSSEQMQINYKNLVRGPQQYTPLFGTSSYYAGTQKTGDTPQLPNVTPPGQLSPQLSGKMTQAALKLAKKI